MATQIKITTLNYFGESTGSTDYNAKVLYTKYGKTRLAHVYVDFFNQRIYVSKNQPKECQVLTGLASSLNDYYRETKGRL